MNKLKSISLENYVLATILLIALVLRLLGLDSSGYGNDELSALNRVQFSGLGELLRLGVKEGDMHPAGVQLFLWIWVKIGGTSEIWVRLPFALCGVASVYMLYRLGRCMFDSWTGLLAAGIFATLEYSLHLSNQARPYSPGMLFVLITAYAWARIVIRHDAKLHHFIGFSVALAATAYTHYYAALMAAFISFTGLLFLDRSELKYYLLAGMGAVLLFLPHLAIFQYQMEIGGLEGWLGPPEKGWLQDYLHFALNSSDELILVCIVIIAGGLIFNFRRNRMPMPYIITVVWFFGAFLFGYLYSIHISPILHEFSMFFAFPFLLLFGCGIVINPDRKWLSISLIAIITLTTAWSTVFSRDYFHAHRIACFKELGEALGEWQLKYGAENLDGAVNVNHPYYIHFYLDKVGFKDSLTYYIIEDQNDLRKIYDLAKNSTKNYMAFGWSSRSTSPLADELIMKYFPYIKDRRTFVNSAITLYSKSEGEIVRPVFDAAYFFKDKGHLWNHGESTIRTDSVAGNYGLLTADDPYSPVFETSASNLRFNKGRYIAIDAEVKKENPESRFHIVYQIERKGEIVDRQGEKSWYGLNINLLYDEVSDWYKYTHARRWDPHIKPTDMIKIYLWNDGGDSLWVRNIRVRIMEE